MIFIKLKSLVVTVIIKCQKKCFSFNLICSSKGEMMRIPPLSFVKVIRKEFPFIIWQNFFWSALIQAIFLSFFLWLTHFDPLNNVAIKFRFYDCHRTYKIAVVHIKCSFVFVLAFRQTLRAFLSKLRQFEVADVLKMVI